MILVFICSFYHFVTPYFKQQNFPNYCFICGPGQNIRYDDYVTGWTTEKRFDSQREAREFPFFRASTLAVEPI